jgi:hypothetical protein
LVAALVARVRRARDAVVAGDRRARFTVVQRIARLDAVTKLAIAARAIVRRVIALIGRLVARVGRTRNPVAASRRRTGLAVVHQITGLDAVTELTVTARGIVRGVETLIRPLVTAVDGAHDAVAAVDGRPSSATVYRVADLHAVAELAVGARPVIGGVSAYVVSLVAAIHRTRDAVATVDRRAGLAPVRNATRLHTVAILEIIADGVVRNVGARVRGLVAGIEGAREAITTDDRRARLATVDRVADLRTVTILPIAARRVVRRMDARVAALVATV